MPDNGSTVTVHYTGRLDDGTQFDSSRDRDPLTFELGKGQVIPGFESAVRDLEVGQTATVRLEPEEAYGHHDPEKVVSVPAERAPEGLSVGDRVLLGQTPATVVSVEEDVVRVDANHPLAGEALTFELELVAVE